MEDSSRERAACPPYTAIGVVAGRWKPMLFQRLFASPQLCRTEALDAGRVGQSPARTAAADGGGRTGGQAIAHTEPAWRPVQVLRYGAPWGRSPKCCGAWGDDMSTVVALTAVPLSRRLGSRPSMP